MMVSRRGFLGTLAAALVGTAASFDPLRGLWVPQSTVEAVTIEGLEELNDLTLRFAKLMAERLGDARVIALRQVVYQQGPEGALKVDGLDMGNGRAGFFEPTRRIVKTGHVGADATAFLRMTADQTLREIRHLDGYHKHPDAFAPMSKELRPGVPFTDSLVTVVADPASGLSARGSRFTDINGTVLTSMELKPGWLHGGGRKARLHFSERFDPDRWDA